MLVRTWPDGNHDWTRTRTFTLMTYLDIVIGLNLDSSCEHLQVVLTLGSFLKSIMNIPRVH